MPKINVTFIDDALVSELIDDLRMIGPDTGGGWFFGFECADGNESPLSGPYPTEQAARDAAEALNDEFYAMTSDPDYA